MGHGVDAPSTKTNTDTNTAPDFQEKKVKRKAQKPPPKKDKKDQMMEEHKKQSQLQKQKQKQKQKEQKKRDEDYSSLKRLLHGLRSSLDADHAVTRALPAVTKALQYPSGDDTLDLLTAYGVSLFNIGSLKQAIAVLEPLVQYRDDLYSALIALASSYAIDGDLRKAFTTIDLVTQHMDEEEWTFDICERRAQVPYRCFF